MRALLMLGMYVMATVALSTGLCLATVASSNAEQVLRAGQTFRDCPECPEMMVIPAGQFLMGSSDKDIQRDVAGTVPFDEADDAKMRMAFEQPQHQNVHRIPLPRP